VINTNLKALAAQESMRSTDLKLSAAMERLSTGQRINAAKDDAAGLAITNRMTSQIRGIAKAVQNTNDAISMTQTAEGAYGSVNDILQRMRELAVQSATGTMNDSDRSSMQLEVTQLRMQIDDIATKTNHNNIKLLDGSAQKVVIQTGPNSGDTMNIGFSSVKTKDIGEGTKAVLTSIGGKLAADSYSALKAGELYLNGVAVGVSQDVDDTASLKTTAGNAAASAIAKAAAINRVADKSGVYARVDTNTVSGQAMVSTAASTGTITINGITTDSFATTTDLAMNRKSVVVAVNAISRQTGVVAVDTGDDTLGVTLQAADGRNIDVETTFVSTSLGIVAGASAASTYVGSYDLFTLDGRSINVSSSTGDDTNIVLDNAGLIAGTYAADTALFSTKGRGAINGTPAVGNGGLMSSDALIINGVQIGGGLTTDDNASYFSDDVTSSVRSSSAIAIAAAINPGTINGRGPNFGSN